MLGRADRRRAGDIVITATAHRAAEGESDGVGPGVVAPGAGLAERGEAEHDQVGIVVGERERIEGAIAAGLAGFEHDVRVGGELEEEFEAVGAVQVERERALAGGVVPPVEAALGAGLVVEERAVAAADVAVGRLDLDHVGAESC